MRQLTFGNSQQHLKDFSQIQVSPVNVMSYDHREFVMTITSYVQPYFPNEPPTKSKFRFISTAK
jgi:hypothetical protein